MRTPVLLPSGAAIVVVIEPEAGGRFRISDLGQVQDEAETLEFGRLYRRQLEDVAKLQGFAVEDGALVLSGLERADLPGATMSLVNALSGRWIGPCCARPTASPGSRRQAGASAAAPVLRER